jgi:hypothetical protein
MVRKILTDQFFHDILKTYHNYEEANNDTENGGQVG